MLPGHYGRLASATVPDIETLKEEMAGMEASVLGVKIDEMQDMLRRLSKDKAS